MDTLIQKPTSRTLQSINSASQSS